MTQDVVINKIQSIQRAREVYAKADDFAHDFSRQDAAILNITRACEQSIDLANHITCSNSRNQVFPIVVWKVLSCWQINPSSVISWSTSYAA